LRRIIEEVATHESKHARSDVAVVTDSTAVRVRRGLRGNGLEGELAGGSVIRGFVEDQLVVEPGADGVETDVQVFVSLLPAVRAKPN